MKRLWFLSIVLGSFLPLRVAFSAPARPAIPPEEDTIVEPARAPVELNGQMLFDVRGTSAYPPEKRAKRIHDNLRAVAQDKTFSPESLRSAEEDLFISLMAGEKTLMRVFDADAEGPRMTRALQAEIYRQRMVEAIQLYRQDRKPDVLIRHGVYALAATMLAFGLFLLIRRIFRGLEALFERRFKKHLEGLQNQSFQLIQAKSVESALMGLFRGAHAFCTLVLVFIWLNVTLGLFPWTRPLAHHLAPLLLSPLQRIGLGFVNFLPNLIFLFVLITLAHYALKLVRLFFAGVERGTVSIKNFDQDWAWPTYKIVWLLVVSFVAVIAYPYIPGSESDAFKGVGLFLGVVFSLGSSSVISNLIAGYSMTYRRAFKVGDRVRIGDVIGEVLDAGLVVTRIRTPKNENVVVPNSSILNSNVINYSVHARKEGLILHTTVGIGYETPWRQVEAMLLQAAERTPGLLKQPPPFVLQRELGDFAVTYEINAYSNEPQSMLRLYSALHQNILDIFNEYGVQIMTPAYEGDPETPKLVTKDKWFEPPAAPSADKTK